MWVFFFGKPHRVLCKYQCKGQGKKCDHQVPSPWHTDILICIFLPLLAAAAHAIHSSAQPRSSNCSSWQINRNWFHYNDKNSIISYNMCKISGYIIKSFSFLTFFSESIQITTCAWQDMHCRLTKANKKKFQHLWVSTLQYNSFNLTTDSPEGLAHNEKSPQRGYVGHTGLLTGSFTIDIDSMTSSCVKCTLIKLMNSFYCFRRSQEE